MTTQDATLPGIPLVSLRPWLAKCARFLLLVSVKTGIFPKGGQTALSSTHALMDIGSILRTYRHIAVVGISDKPHRPSYGVARYLLQSGYELYPVNPTIDAVLGMKCWPSLSSIPEEIRKHIEIVVIFRKPADVPPVVDEAIATGARVIWMQLGITNDAAADKARKAGLTVVQNRCIAVEHQRLDF